MQKRTSQYPIDPSVRKRAVNQSKRIEALGRVPLFSSLSKRSLTRIDRITAVKNAREGDVLMREGDAGTEMMVVLDGRASASRGKRKLGECTTGQWFGEMALLDKQPRSATITALQDMKLLVIPGDEFRKMLVKVPGLAEALLSNLSDRLREANAAADF